MSHRHCSCLHPIATASALSLAVALAGCGKEPEKKTIAQPFDPAAVTLDDPDLIAGQQTWLGTCKTCHMTGLTGAPIIGNTEAWAPRIAKGLDTLYDHALNGFIGPKYTEMPPKGGFTELSDEEVKQAVRFMTHVSK
ncbi:c-type cytochrome [Pelagicoccus sp. SDUM812003]|uniref:c-type cytochrome n=1 Tax=Pelagicoccus sp. SDUM812003 TaxID=3041267 RepID=UPI00280C4140|nr:c-type cytochrome [Pelagicoccus sp. SDUM812003]MDQ8203706.1 c-type cytochrome [Pelagicoccus sp. SDUM812003]